MPAISGTTRVFYILGDPVAQVRAPEVYNALFQAHGIDAVLVPLKLPAAALAGFLQHGLAAENIGGFWATIPHKPMLAELLQPDAPSRPERDTTCSRLLALQADANARNPSFWGDIAVADLKLARLLARCAGGGPAPRLPETCLELSQEVTEAYQAALARGASERERASVTEHIDFLIRLTAPKSPQLAFLQTLRNTLA